MQLSQLTWPEPFSAMLELSTLSLVLSPEDESLVPPLGVQRLRCLPKVRFYTGANKNCLCVRVCARMRGQAELGCHFAALYPHAQLSRFYPWFYLYVTHVRSVPRRSAFSYWKRKKAGTAGYEARA